MTTPDGAFCASLDTALTLVEQCGEPNAGVCLDAFHFYKGPSKPEDLERVTAKNLFHVQVCDVAGVPRELMIDADRVMPGEGDFRLEPLVRRLKEINYTGAVSLELMNPVRRGICEMKGTIFVGEKLVAEADMVAQIVKKPKVKV